MLSPALNEETVARYRREGLWAGRTLIDDACELAATGGSAPVFLGETCATDYASLLADAHALAAALWERGLRPGDVIAFQLPNWIETAVINLAACRLGLVCNPLMPIYRDAELAFMLNDSRTRAAFVPSSFRGFDFDEMYARLRPELAHRPTVITVRGTGDAGERYEDLLAAGQGRAVTWPQVSPSDTKLLLYTSGTTGRPKAVLHSHETLARAVKLSATHWGIAPGDVVLMPSPVTHATGYASALELPFLQGTRTVLMERWDAAEAVALIERYNIAATIGATPFLKELTAAARASGSRLPSLRVFACGGAAVPPEVIYEANRVFARQPAFRAYGSSEVPYVALGRPGGASADEATTTDGQVIDYDVRVRDDEGRNLAPGQAGEIVARGPALFLGYANAGDTDDCFTADGYFRTGDIGVLTAARWLTITGRKKDLIIRGGENISAKEIEDVLHRHPQIAEAAVVSMPHERLGEGVFAFVITRDGAALDFDALVAHLRTSGLARQKHPERMTIVTQFPRTASGKIRKDILRQMAVQIVAAAATVGSHETDGGLMKTTAHSPRMIAPDLVAMADKEMRIVAGLRTGDGQLVFPMPTHESEKAAYEKILLSGRGTLWSWTVQRFRPKTPPYRGPDGDAFRPFFVGYVEFPEGIVVEGRIDARVDVDELRIGMPMETTAIASFTDEDGEVVHTHGFRPVDQHHNSNRS